MKKTFKIYTICWSILFIIFNLVVFLTPSEIVGISKLSSSFWVSYIFIVLSFVGQFVCTHFVFKQDNLQKFFYNVSLITISYWAVILSTVVSILCMTIPFIPTWLSVVVCLLLLGFSIVSVLKAKATAEIVSEIDNKITEQTSFIKSLTVDAESLIMTAKSDSIKRELKKVYEAVRYADPMSSDTLSDIEAQVALKFDFLLKSVEADDIAEVKEAVGELIVLIKDRDNKCMLLK